MAEDLKKETKVDTEEQKIENNKKFNFKSFLKSKNFLLLLLAVFSSVTTLFFFYFSNSFFKFEKKIDKKIDIYKVAKEEAIKLGRLEPEEDEKAPIIGADGKVIIPSLTYHDVGGMGPNSNKSFVSNLKDSNDYLSMEIAFSSYKGEKLGNVLKDFDADFRNIIMNEIDKRKTEDFMGSDKRQKFLIDVRDKMNEFLIKKDEDPVIFNAILKTFVINQH